MFGSVDSSNTLVNRVESLVGQGRQACADVVCCNGVFRYAHTVEKSHRLHVASDAKSQRMYWAKKMPDAPKDGSSGKCLIKSTFAGYRGEEEGMVHRHPATI